MDWINITTVNELEDLSKKSELCGLLKHSHRCTMSEMAKYILENELNSELPMYLINVIDYPSVAKAASRIFSEPHESPQFLLIDCGECIFESSKLDISTEEIQEELAYLRQQ